MVLFLVHNILYNNIPLAFGIRECTIPRLPLKFAFNQLLVVNPFTAACFYGTHKIGDAGGNRHAKKYMHMVFPAANRQGFCPFFGNNAGNIFMQIVAPTAYNKITPVLYSKHAMD